MLEKDAEKRPSIDIILKKKIIKNQVNKLKEEIFEFS